MKSKIIVAFACFMAAAGCARDGVPTSVDNEPSDWIENEVINAGATLAFSGNINGFDGKRGFMLGDSSAESLTEMAEWGANLVRVQMVFPPRLSEYNDRHEYAAAYLTWAESKAKEIKDELAPRCGDNGIAIVVDLHHGPDKLFRKQWSRRLFRDVWISIATTLKDVDEVLAYDLLNEPNSGRRWQQLASNTARLIRGIDNKTLIVVQPRLGDPRHFEHFEPIRTRGVVYSAHVYFKLPYTHQWVADPDCQVPTGRRQWRSYPSTYLDKKKLRRNLRFIKEFQRRASAPIYIGEFSAARWAPGAAQYLRDLTEMFNRRSWAWSYHAWRESPVWDLEISNCPEDSCCDAETCDPLPSTVYCAEFQRQTEITDRGHAIRDGLQGATGNNMPPTARATSDSPVVDTDGDGSARVSLTDLSDDSDGEITSWEWHDGSGVLLRQASGAVTLPVGEHHVDLVVTDDEGATGSTTTVVVVSARPNTPPVARPGSHQAIVDYDGDNRETALLDGRQSYDSDGTIVTYEWFHGGHSVLTGAYGGAEFPVGTHSVRLRVTDDDGAVHEATTQVAVAGQPALQALYRNGFESGLSDFNVGDRNPAKGRDYWGLSRTRPSRGSFCVQSNAVTDRRDGNYSNEMRAYLKLHAPLNVDGFYDCRLAFDLRHRIADGDYLQLLYRRPGGDWTVERQWVGRSGWSEHSVPITGNIELKFLFITNSRGVDTGVSIDRFQVRGRRR